MSDSGRTMREQCRYCDQVHDDYAPSVCIDNLVNQRDKLIEALRPLAAIAGNWHPTWPDETFLINRKFLGASLELGQARRADALLRELEGGRTATPVPAAG